MVSSPIFPSAAPFVPKHFSSLAALAKAARGCKGCDLYKEGTQTVFGEGPQPARIVLFGEQPGDQEDRQGKPFVGPAGQMLDKALAEAGIPRRDVYISNVVKHFRFLWKGKLRFHQKPAAGHIRACRPWLEAELAVIKPEVIICLGATAAQSIFQKSVTITSLRGKIHSLPLAKAVIVTVHPSSLLRAPDEESRHVAYKGFVDDLKLIHRL